MTTDAWITLAVIAVLCVAFVMDRLAPTVVMGAGVVTLYLLGVVDAAEAFSGFSNIAPLTVAALYVLAGAADITGGLSGITSRALGDGSGSSSPRKTLARTTLPVAAASAFIANTPLVAMLAPRISAWARRSGQSPSHFLIPLSYAAILGGVITVLGTSTNLVMSGLLDQAGEEPLSVFEITPVGLPIALLGVAVMVLVAPRLLPERRTPDQDFNAVREFTVELLVTPGGPLDERSVTDAGLRNLQGVYLVEVIRPDRVIAPVDPDQTLRGGDRLVFAGAVDRVVDLQGVKGLVMAEEHHVRPAAGNVGHRFYEAVISPSSELNGATLKEVGFRSLFGAAVMAVHRAGDRLGGRLGDQVLRSGDVLLVVSHDEWAQDMRGRDDFSVVAPYGGAAPLRRRGARIVEIATLALVVVAGAGLVDLTKTAMAVALGLMALRVVTPTEARRSINLDIIAMIAFSFGLGAAVEASGLASVVASGLVDLTSSMGDVGILVGIALGTLLATELLSNNAAAALMFPVALATAAETGIDIRPLAIVIVVVASCSFLTPIGYQTNTMVFGMGGYRFTDFTRVGIPITVTVLTTVIVLTPLAFPLRP